MYHSVLFKVDGSTPRIWSNMRNFRCVALLCISREVLGCRCQNTRVVLERRKSGLYLGHCRGFLGLWQLRRFIE